MYAPGGTAAPQPAVKDEYESEESDSENDDEYEARAGHRKHRCTDVVCILVFLAALGFLGYILRYCAQDGDFRRLFHGYDFLGNLCGVDKPESFLYWCPNEQSLTSLDLKHPICVASCPKVGSNTSCVQMPPLVSDPVVIDSQGTFNQTMTYRMKQLPTYNSHPRAGKYCFPENNTLATEITKSLKSNWATKLAMEASSVLNSWAALLMSAILAFILGYVFLCVINWCIAPIVCLCMTILIVAPFVAGVYLLVVGFREGEDGTPSTGDPTWDKIVGTACLLLFFFFAVLTCCALTSIRTAIGCVEAATECMMSLPSLLLQPLINVTLKMLAFLLLLIGFLWLLSCGTVQKLTLQEYAMAELPGSDLSGVFRTFHYEDTEVYYILYYIFIIFWVMELFNALGQFVISYAVQLWYFTPYVSGDKEDIPPCPICRGYCVAVFFHIGSLAFGSLLIALVRIIRLLFSIFVKQLNRKDANPVVGCIGRVCSCCLWCFEKCLAFLNKNAYMDIAITSSNFCTAARHALEIIVRNFPAIAFLNGACWVIYWAGLGAITAAGSYLTWLIIRGLPFFNTETSDHYVEDPVTVTIVAGIISLLIAMAFMSVFDTVADTVLYCFAVENIRRRKGEYLEDVYAPPTLRKIIQETHDDGF